MDTFIGAVFADKDSFSFSSKDTTHEWMIWMRADENGEAIQLDTFARKDSELYNTWNVVVDATTLQQHMNDLGVKSDISSFSTPFKTAVSSLDNVHLDIDSNGQAFIELSYIFGTSLRRNGHFALDNSACSVVPLHVVSLLRNLHTTMQETNEQQAARRKLRSIKQMPLSTISPLELSDFPQSNATPSNTLLKRKALPLGARRRVAKGAKFDSDD